VQIELKLQKELHERDLVLQTVIKDVAHSLEDAENSFRNIRETLAQLAAKKSVDSL
jgi:hypothetical protein